MVRAHPDGGAGLGSVAALQRTHAVSHHTTHAPLAYCVRLARASQLHPTRSSSEHLLVGCGARSCRVLTPAFTPCTHSRFHALRPLPHTQVYRRVRERAVAVATVRLDSPAETSDAEASDRLPSRAPRSPRSPESRTSPRSPPLPPRDRLARSHHTARSGPREGPRGTVPRAASPRAASQREREGLTAEGRFEEQLRSTRALASLEASRSAQLLREEQLRRARVEHEWLSLQRASELQLATVEQRLETQAAAAKRQSASLQSTMIDAMARIESLQVPLTPPPPPLQPPPPCNRPYTFHTVPPPLSPPQPPL